MTTETTREQAEALWSELREAFVNAEGPRERG